jgi:hypothetical protein
MKQFRPENYGQKGQLQICEYWFLLRSTASESKNFIHDCQMVNIGLCMYVQFWIIVHHSHITGCKFGETFSAEKGAS